jgi:hypothetical protein
MGWHGFSILFVCNTNIMAILLTRRSSGLKKPAAAKKKKKPLLQKPPVKKDISKSYNQHKDFEGKQYTGMQVGRTENGLRKCNVKERSD